MRNDGAVLTMSGRAATNPTISGSKGERVSFRAVSTERRFDDASNDWIDGDEFGVSVVCWRQLGTAVLQLIRKGDPVIIEGRISTRKFDRNGVTDYFTECKADHVALDVARAGSRIKRMDGSAPVDNSPAKAAEAGPGEPGVTDGDREVGGPADGEPEGGDPFQEAGRPGATRELTEVF